MSRISGSGATARAHGAASRAGSPLLARPSRGAGLALVLPPWEAPLALPAAALERLFSAPGLCLRRMPGRETVRVDDSPFGPAVVKRFAREPARERWLARLRDRRPRSPARREFESLLGLAALGVRVPRALALLEDPISGESAVVMELVRHREHLAERCARTARAEPELVLRLARLVARLHAAGWYHRDLYLQHVVALEDGELVLLDVGRARRQRRPRSRWFVKDLAALWHSLAPEVDRRAGWRFLVVYGRALAGERRVDRAGRARLRRLAARARAKAARMAAHAPRHADLRPRAAPPGAPPP